MMSRAQKRAIKEYPVRMETNWTVRDMGYKEDTNETRRLSFTIGYMAAENDYWVRANDYLTKVLGMSQYEANKFYLAVFGEDNEDEQK